jgi:hypothetical protein
MNHLSCSKRGCVVEYKAANVFLEAGLEVFMNMAPDGPADFIVWDGITAYPIDTKKITRRIKADGTVGYSSGMGPRNYKPGVYYLGWCQQDGFVWLSQEVPEALSNII